MCYGVSVFSLLDVNYKKDLIYQALQGIIYLERLSEANSDCPQLFLISYKELAFTLAEDASSFCYDYLCKIEPQRLLVEVLVLQ